MDLPLVPAAPSGSPPPLPAGGSGAGFHRRALTEPLHSVRLPAVEPFAGAAPAPEPSVPGRHLAHWSDPLLELILCHLTLGELMRCGLVCRQWHRVASDFALQARCCLHSYPVHQRRELLLPLRSCLALPHFLWPGWLSHGLSQQGLALSGESGGPPASFVFYSLLRNRLQATQLDQAQGQVIRRGRQPVQASAWSPDGRYLAAASSTFPDDDGVDVTLWRMTAEGQVLAGLFYHPAELSAMRFHADGHRLELLDPEGGLQTLYWQEDAGRWQTSGTRFVSPGVIVAQLSPDGSTLALSACRQVQIFTAGQPGVWHQQWSQPWKTTHRRCAVGAEAVAFPDCPTSLVFSRGGTHLALASSQQVWACHRHAACWRELPVESGVVSCTGNSSPDAVVLFDDAGHSLAAAFWQGWKSFFGCLGRFALHLWRFRPAYGWQSVRQIRCESLVKGVWPLALAFSPDSRYLACPVREGEGQVLCLFATTGKGEAAAIRLALPFGLSPPGASTVSGLQFSPTGAYLVACATSGVHIWRQHPWRGWETAAWIPCIERQLATSARAVFSPDGCHCALATGRAARLRIFGPCGREYGEKMVFPRGALVRTLQFSPDGSLLLADMYDDQASHGQWHLWQCMPLVPLTWPRPRRLTPQAGRQ